MKTIRTTKRLYSIAASPPLKSSVRTPTSPRPRRASLSLASAAGSPSSCTSASGSSNVAGSSSNRSLYTNASGPLHYFDSAGPPPPPPPPASRPSNPHIVSTSRLSVGEAQTQTAQGNAPGNGPTTHSAQSPYSPHTADGTQPTQQSSHGQSHHGQTSGGQQAEGGSQPLLGSSSLMLSLGGPAPPPGSSPPDHSMLLSGPHSGLAADQAWRSRESAADIADRQAKEEENITSASSRGSQKIYQLDVGAYGIPKRGRENGRGRSCMCAICVEEEERFALDSLDGAVQVGEDAYFVREDALGVADGVGGWGSRASSSRTSSFHSCSTCAAASSSAAGRHAHRHRHSHKFHAAQSSPSALFARRLMHFCAHEVGEARASAVVPKPGDFVKTEQSAEPAPIRAKPSLKHSGVTPRATTYGRQKTVVREHGNARPFAWPWEVENETEHTGLGVLVEEDFGAEKMAAALGASKERTSTPEDASKAVPDPLEGTIDPVNVLERAYSQTIDAHRVRRRVRVVKTQKTAPRWWSYGLGLGSTTPSLSSTSLHDTLPTGREELEDCEWEWQESWEPLSAGSSTALLAVLSGDRLRVAHLGDCVGWLVRAGEIVWRSEEMWWGFNYPVQLGPSSPSRPADARRYELSVQADDILILASDGMSDNCWEEDVLDEVRRAVEAHLPLAQDAQTERSESEGVGLLGRRTLAGMLSEALCSRARQLSTQAHGARRADGRGSCAKEIEKADEVDELPFARRAREEGRSFRGGKCDDISVLVAIISPVSTTPTASASPAVDSKQESESSSHVADISEPVQPMPMSTNA